MDWHLKAPWGLTELQQETLPNTQTVGGSSRFAGHKTSNVEFSVDLKLGQLGNSANELLNKWKDPEASKISSPASGSSKRARAANNGNQAVSCLVDGCTSDLSNCRDYHRRHKVCELHSKTPEVTICGHKQRFCQQCSRYYTSDGICGSSLCSIHWRNSMREREAVENVLMDTIEGGESLSQNPCLDLGTSCPLTKVSYDNKMIEPIVSTEVGMSAGIQLIPFSSSNAYPSTTMASPAWVGVPNTAADARLHNQQQQLWLLDKEKLFLESSPSNYSANRLGGKQMSFLQGGSTVLNHHSSLEAPVCQPLLKTIALSQSGGARSKIFGDRLTTQLHDSDCALSLLSSPQAQSSGLALNHAVHPNSVSLVQPLGSSLHGNCLDPMNSVLMSSGSDSIVHCRGRFHMGTEESQVNETPQTFPFNWE